MLVPQLLAAASARSEGTARWLHHRYVDATRCGILVFDAGGGPSPLGVVQRAHQLVVEARRTLGLADIPMRCSNAVSELPACDGGRPAGSVAPRGTSSPVAKSRGKPLVKRTEGRERLAGVPAPRHDSYVPAEPRRSHRRRASLRVVSRRCNRQNFTDRPSQDSIPFDGWTAGISGRFSRAVER